MKDVPNGHFEPILAGQLSNPAQTEDVTNMAQRTGKAIRIQAGDQALIRADLIAVSPIDSPVARISMHLIEEDGGMVSAAIPEDSLQGLISAALLAAGLATSSNYAGCNLSKIVEVPRALPIDDLKIPQDPEASGAPVGHVVMEIFVGTVPFQLSAPAPLLKNALEALIAHTANARARACT